MAVTKPVRGIDSLSKGICQYPLVISNFDMNFAFPTRSIKASTLGMGNGSATVTEFNLRKSVHNLPDPSGFGTTKIGAAHGLSDSSINPSRRRSSISRSTFDCFSGCNQYGA